MRTPIIRTAWGLIGYEGLVRVVGGRSTYDSVDHNCARARTNNVRLSTLSHTRNGRLRAVMRYVDADTLIELLDDDAAERLRYYGLD